MHTDASPAVEAAARWAAPSWIRRETFKEAVTSTEKDVLATGRIRWRGRSRRIESRQSPTTSSARKLQEPCRPSEFDPWHEEAATLPGRTLRLIRCPTCEGEKKVACPVCVGQGSTLCGHCAGSGRSYSSRSRRMIRCSGCRGTGRSKCSCRSGQVPCAACAGLGKVDSWLEVSEDTFDRIEWTEENALTQALKAGRPGDTSPPPERHWSGASLNQAPTDLQSLLCRSQGFRSLDFRRDRVHAVEIDLYRLAVERVHYQLCGVPGFVEVQEWDLRLLENPGSREPLNRRRRRITLGALGAAGAGFLLALIYGLRHPYFTTVANYRWLWGIALLAGVLALPLLALSALPRRPPGRVGLAALPLLLIAGLQAALATTSRPSLAEARALAQRREIDQALFVASACADLGIQPQQAGELHDNLQLARIRQIADPQQAWKALDLPFRTETGRRRAAEHAVQVTARTAGASQTAGDWRGSEEILGLVPHVYQDQPPILTVRWGLLANEVESKWNVIRSREPSLEARLEECRWMQRALPVLDSLGPAPRPAPVEQEQAEELCERLRADQAREIERQRREEERERKRQERRATAAQRAWAYSPLRCNDGTLSPSCVCGQSSRRGCCSHHGGVDGCSAPYP